MPFIRDRLLATDMRSLVLVAGVGTCLILGGTDVDAPWLDVAVQSVTALIACWWLISAPAAQLATVHRAAWVIYALVVLVPVVQLIPLPPGIWQGLPGRGLERQALELIGQANSWQPLSLVPARTLASALSMAATALYIPLMAGMDRGGRSRVLLVIIVVALLSIIVGTRQVVGDLGNLFVDAPGPNHILYGFQRNRNSEADLLLIAMLASACCAGEIMRLSGMERRRQVIVLLVMVLTLVLTVSIVLTASRTGILLIAPVVVLQLAILRRYVSFRLTIPALLTLAATAAVALWALADNPLIQSVLARFQEGLGDRTNVWAQTQQLMDTYWTWGTGLGGVGPAFSAVEPVVIVSTLSHVHAFNDYAQLIMEAGVIGGAVAAIVLLLALLAAVRGFARPVWGSDCQHLFAVGVLLLLGAHSWWDYPLRSPSLACIAACCIGLLLPRSEGPSRKGDAA